MSRRTRLVAAAVLELAQLVADLYLLWVLAGGRRRRGE